MLWKVGEQRMKKKNIIFIACAITVLLIVAVTVYFVVTNNKSENLNSEQKIIIEKYNENFEVEKTIEITDEKQIKEITKICENPSLEQDDVSISLGIKNEVKVDFGNGRFFMIQLDIPEYCHYEDLNTKLRIKMPDGLLEKVNEILAENQ